MLLYKNGQTLYDTPAKDLLAQESNGRKLGHLKELTDIFALITHMAYSPYVVQSSVNAPLKYIQ